MGEHGLGAPQTGQSGALEGAEPTAVGPRLVSARSASAPIQFLLRYGIVLALLALGAFFAWRSDVFLTDDNLLQILLQASVNTIVALGMTFVVITAGIDLRSARRRR